MRVWPPSGPECQVGHTMSMSETIPVSSEVGRDRAPFTLPQFGIFAQGTRAHHFLEFDLKPGVTPAQAVSGFREPRTPDVSAGGRNLVLAFGDVTWHSARAAFLAVADVALLATEQEGFTYHGGRVITGFIDATANPQVRRAADVAVVPPAHRGAAGSHVLTVRWVLACMFGNDPDGARDRLTNFTSPVSGGYYFAPSVNALNKLAGEE